MKKRFLNYKTDEFWQIEVTENLLVTTHGRMGRLGKKELRSLGNEKKCLKEAEKLIMDRKKTGYFESIPDVVQKHELPKELRDSLGKIEVAKTTACGFELFPLHDIRLITIIVDDIDLPERSVRNKQNSPSVRGRFCHSAYALGRDTRDPGRFFVWLPVAGSYGLWCRRAHRLHMFLNVNWKSIEKDLSYYLCASEQSPFPLIQSVISLDNQFAYIPGDLVAQMNQILSLSDDTRRRKVEEFLTSYELRLLSLPFSAELEKEYKTLVTFYYHIGQWLESDSHYAAAIKWFEKALMIMNQAIQFRTIFADIFLQLSFCYLKSSQFELALVYIDLFTLHDPSSLDACQGIKANIRRTQQLYKETMNAYLNNIETGSDTGHKEADNLIKRKIKSAPHDPVLHFNLACFYSSSNRIEKALYHLEEAFKRGYRNHESVIREGDLENVRRTREFENIRLKYLFIIT